MKSQKVTIIIANIAAIAACLCVVIPFVLLIIASFTANIWATANGFSFFPGEWSTEAYRYILVRMDMIGRAYMMSIIVTVLGTAISIAVTTLFAYAIAQNDVPGMALVRFLLIFTMLFHGGLVASYYTYIKLIGIKNTIWALILPGGMIMSAFNVILVRNYFKNSIPISISEAARIDGANEFRIFMQINMPLSKPIVATVGLLTALGYWNNWTNGMYYLSERGGGHLYTIQNILNNINESIQVLTQNASDAAAMGVDMSEFPSTTVRMAIAIIGIIPVMIVYPLFQQYFVKGITFGGVKE